MVFTAESAALKKTKNKCINKNSNKKKVSVCQTFCDSYFQADGPESLICLRASLSENEDISSGGFSGRFSKPRKETLLQYTTSSDSSGLSLEQTWQEQTAGGTENWSISDKSSISQASLGGCCVSVERLQPLEDLVYTVS